MKNITYPTNFLDRPFADTGNKQIIPENGGSSGRASLMNGFPIETQLPLNQGGVAPNRLDVNGAFYMLSAMAFWQQSGGMWQWSSSMNYTTPCLVFYANKLWWCVQDNGPQSTGGIVVAPGTNDAYWLEFLQALSSMSGSGGGGLVPVGMIAFSPTISPPVGWLACDGNTFSATTYPILASILGEARTPNASGLFIRGYDPGSVNDPDGGARGIGSVQNDMFAAHTHEVVNHAGLGTVLGIFHYGDRASADSSPQLNNEVSNAGGAETRPKNINFLACIKHD